MADCSVCFPLFASKKNIAKVTPGRTFSCKSTRTIEPQLKDQMMWAETFIAMLPMPVCLVDKKGFVHHTNREFNSLITIEHNADLCPFAGRYMNSSKEFRDLIETIAESSIVTVESLVIVWNDTCVVDSKANKSYVWTLSGSSTSSAIVLSGKLFLSPRKLSDAKIEDSGKSNIEKFKLARSSRVLASANPLAQASSAKWDIFYQRCEEGRIDNKKPPIEMEGFMSVLTAVANTSGQSRADDLK